MASISMPYLHALPRPHLAALNPRSHRRIFRLSDNFFSAKSNRSIVSSYSGHDVSNSATVRSESYTVGDFMTKKEDLQVVKPSTTISEAMEVVVEKRLSGFPVVDDDGKLVGVVSDYDLLALDSISGCGQSEINIFPDVNSTWKAFKEIQGLLSKTNGEIIGDVMTPAPLVVLQTTSLHNAARLLLETKFHRLPVVDSDGKLVGIISREDVVRAGLHINKTSRCD